MRDQQIEHNLNYDFSLTGEDGKALEPVFGPGFTGVSNLGNRWVPCRDIVFEDVDRPRLFQLLYGIRCPNPLLPSFIPGSLLSIRC